MRSRTRTLCLSLAARGRALRARLGDDEEGSVTAELIIATPMLFLLVLSIVQFALYEDAAHVAEAAAQQGLAASRVVGGSDQAGTSAANAMLGQIGTAVLAHEQVSTDRGVTATTVTVTGNAEAVLPMLSLSVTATASAPTEVFTTDPEGSAASQGAGP